MTQPALPLPTLGLWTRLLFGVVGTGLLTMLATAVWLEPDPRGMGTHQQLGLPPCTFQQIFKRPCPSCGMTTSWSHIVRGQILKSFEANAGGALLALSAAIAGPWLLISAVRGKLATRSPADVYVGLVAMAIAAVSLLQWGMRMTAE